MSIVKFASPNLVRIRKHSGPNSSRQTDTPEYLACMREFPGICRPIYMASEDKHYPFYTLLIKYWYFIVYIKRVTIWSSYGAESNLNISLFLKSFGNKAVQTAVCEQLFLQAKKCSRKICKKKKDLRLATEQQLSALLRPGVPPTALRPIQPFQSLICQKWRKIHLKLNLIKKTPQSQEPMCSHLEGHQWLTSIIGSFIHAIDSLPKVFPLLFLLPRKSERERSIFWQQGCVRLLWSSRPVSATLQLDHRWLTQHMVSIGRSAYGEPALLF